MWDIQDAAEEAYDLVIGAATLCGSPHPQLPRTSETTHDPRLPRSRHDPHSEHDRLRDDVPLGGHRSRIVGAAGRAGTGGLDTRACLVMGAAGLPGQMGVE
jgi:hypothetical protein